MMSTCISQTELPMQCHLSVPDGTTQAEVRCRAKKFYHQIICGEKVTDVREDEFQREMLCVTTVNTCTQIGISTGATVVKLCDVQPVGFYKILAK